MSQIVRLRALLPTLLILLGWGLLGWNVFVLLGGSSHFLSGDLAEHAARTISTNLLHSAMLAFGAIALTLVAYLHFKQGYPRATLTSGAIAAVLAFSLMYPTISPSSRSGEEDASNKTATELAASEVYEEGLVSGIVFSDDRPAAVIGTQVLYEGDVKNGVTVVKITKEQVQFEKNGRLWTQKVQSSPPKHWR
ncbi:MAG: hypothetical protein ACYS8Z_20270 [Planctomycetota bacterium]|jgi:hypothetical protein